MAGSPSSNAVRLVGQPCAERAGWPDRTPSIHMRIVMDTPGVEGTTEGRQILVGGAVCPTRRFANNGGANRSYDQKSCWRFPDQR